MMKIIKTKEHIKTNLAIGNYMTLTTVWKFQIIKRHIPGLSVSVDPGTAYKKIIKKQQNTFAFSTITIIARMVMPSIDKKNLYYLNMYDI